MIKNSDIASEEGYDSKEDAHYEQDEDPEGAYEDDDVDEESPSDETIPVRPNVIREFPVTEWGKAEYWTFR